MTGHSGFKGSWLAYWLLRLGANVEGYSLPPETVPSLFRLLHLEREVPCHWADIGDYEALSRVVRAFRPEIIFHLAAQALVRVGYEEPRRTLQVNVMGTVNVLEAVRSHPGNVQAVVVVTSDKCYEHARDGGAAPFREADRLGGRDPYSASKGCAEIVTQCLRQSFFADSPIGIGSARAGNVIGGGDWAKDRLIPDLIRAVEAGKPLRVRNHNAVRPWQHVLEPLAGYLLLAERLASSEARFRAGWNFGPDHACRVGELLQATRPWWGSGGWIDAGNPSQPHEAAALRLDTAAARQQLGWRPVWPLIEALRRTMEWYAVHSQGQPLRPITEAQIADYQRDAAADDMHAPASAGRRRQARTARAQ